MSAITIPEGFFPPPGVPFEIDEQRNIGVAMHNAGLIRIQHCVNGIWHDHLALSGDRFAKEYRLAPPKPRTVGPFESRHMRGDGKANNAWAAAIDAAEKAGFANYFMRITATAEEILP